MENDVLDKIRQLYATLEEKISNNDQRALVLKERKDRIGETENKLKAASDHLAARERVLRKYEDFDKEKEEMKASIARNVLLKKKNLDESKALEKRNKDIDAKEKELEASIEMFKNKNARMDALEKELKLEKELMREKILEEIKGKL